MASVPSYVPSDARTHVRSSRPGLAAMDPNESDGGPPLRRSLSKVQIPFDLPPPATLNPMDSLGREEALGALGASLILERNDFSRQYAKRCEARAQGAGAGGPSAVGMRERKR